jgi:hypothetical protein
MKTIAPLAVLVLLGLVPFSSARADHECVAIDGPSNLRESPELKTGKTILKIPKKSTARVLQHVGDWYQVESHISGDTYRCEPAAVAYGDAAIKGWLHKNNVILGLEPAFAIEPCAFFDGGKPTEPSGGSLIFVRDADCASHFDTEDNGTGGAQCLSAHHKKGDRITGRCRVSGAYAICVEKSEGDPNSTDVCLADRVKLGPK